VSSPKSRKTFRNDMVAEKASQGGENMDDRKYVNHRQDRTRDKSKRNQHPPPEGKDA